MHSDPRRPENRVLLSTARLGRGPGRSSVMPRRAQSKTTSKLKTAGCHRPCRRAGGHELPIYPTAVPAGAPLTRQPAWGLPKRRSMGSQHSPRLSFCGGQPVRDAVTNSQRAAAGQQGAGPLAAPLLCAPSDSPAPPRHSSVAPLPSPRRGAVGRAAESRALASGPRRCRGAAGWAAAGCWQSRRSARWRAALRAAPPT